MKTELSMAMSIGVLAVVTASIAVAQSSRAPAAQVLLSSGVVVSSQGQAQGEIVHEIDDPHTGDHWLLMRNGHFPGGPGRLVLATAHRNVIGRVSEDVASQHNEEKLIPVIHAGDRLIVEEHTAVVDAVLQARALNPATVGASLDVRLTIGGSVVRVVALGPGRAALLLETGIQP